MSRFKVGDKVVKNPTAWKPNGFDNWDTPRGNGVGEVVAPPFDVSDIDMVDVRWPGGRCFEEESGLLHATTTKGEPQ